MNPSLQIELAEILSIPIKKMVPLSGGDISKSYLIYAGNERFFCKLHTGQDAYDMFLAEQEGLRAISQTRTVGVPAVVGCGRMQSGACLLLEYIESGKATPVTMEKLGHQLATLHSIRQAEFGWDAPNFIGSIVQSNNRTEQWASFYLKERLLPQLLLACNENRLAREDIPSTNRMMEKLQQYLTHAKPSLLHGDLWSGNYLISTGDIPYLIDPAVYCGHHEADLAMTRLFGGFDPAFYSAYHEGIPRADGYEKREEVYQLYYLLVHLNLFGKAYYNRVRNLLNFYF